MSRNTKIILAVVAGILVVLCLCVGAVVLATSLFFINSSVSVSPAHVDTVIERAVQVNPAPLAEGDIASLTLPHGWQTDYSVRVAGFRVAGYRPASGDGHITLAVLPETPHASIEELERELRAIGGSYGYRWNQREMQVVERKPVTVHEQATEMVVAEGTGSSGKWRQAMVSYRGDQGLTLVIYGMPAAAYDQAEADALFASIR